MHVRGEDASNVTVAAVTSFFFVLIVFAETIDCSLQTEVNYSISVNNIHFYSRMWTERLQSRIPLILLDDLVL